MTGLVAIAAFIVAPVLAADPSVPVQADVVFASTAPGAIDPSLQKMHDALAAKVKYTTMKKVESKKLELVKDRPQSLPLPNKKVAEITLQGVAQNVATLKVKLAPAEATYTLAKDKALYLQGGAHDTGEVWLSLSQPK